MGGNSGGINVGSIYADLELDSGKLEEGLARGRQAMAMIEKEIKQLQADLNRGAIGLNEYNARWAVLNSTMAQLVPKMQAAYAAVQASNGGLDIANKSMGDATKGARNLGFAMMQLGSIFDDAQYGMKGVLNNIGPLAMGLSGGNMAVAGAAQIAATAAYQLYEHWDQLMDLFGKGIPAGLKEQIRELAAEAVKAAEGVGDAMKSMREEQARMDSREKRPSKEQAKASSEYEDAVAEGGAAKIEGAIAAKLGDYKATDEERAEIRKQVGLANPLLATGAGVERMSGGTGVAEGSYLKRMQDLEDKAVAEYERKQTADRARRLLDDASGHGPNAENARKQIAGMVEEAPAGMFPPEFAKHAVDATPENRKQQEKFEEGGKANEANYERGQRERKANAAKAKAEHAAMVERLEEQERAGKEHERAVMGQVDEKAPRLRKQVEDARLREQVEGAAGIKGGKSVLDQVMEALIKQGYSKDDANMAAHNLVSDADKSIRSKVAGADTNPEEEPRRQSRNSEVFATSDLAHKVQQAVGQQETPGEKKANNYREQMIKYLATIAANGPGFQPQGWNPGT